MNDIKRLTNQEVNKENNQLEKLQKTPKFFANPFSDHNTTYKISILALFLIIFFPNVAVLADDTKLAELFYSLSEKDHFGISISQIGDLDNDGIMDIAVGSYKDDDGGQDRGAIYIIFLNDDGTAKSFQKISGEKETSWLQNIEYLIYGIVTIAIISGFFIAIRRRSTKSS